jgi:hypothetical protein
MPRRDVEDTWFVIIVGVNAFADASNATRNNSFAAMVKVGFRIGGKKVKDDVDRAGNAELKSTSSHSAPLLLSLPSPWW